MTSTAVTATFGKSLITIANHLLGTEMIDNESGSTRWWWQWSVMMMMMMMLRIVGDVGCIWVIECECWYDDDNDEDDDDYNDV